MKKRKRKLLSPFKLNLLAKEANIDKLFFLKKKKKKKKKKKFNDSKDGKPKNYHPKKEKETRVWFWPNFSILPSHSLSLKCVFSLSLKCWREKQGALLNWLWGSPGAEFLLSFPFVLMLRKWGRLATKKNSHKKIGKLGV